MVSTPATDSGVKGWRTLEEWPVDSLEYVRLVEGDRPPKPQPETGRRGAARLPSVTLWREQFGMRVKLNAFF